MRGEGGGGGERGRRKGKAYLSDLDHLGEGSDSTAEGALPSDDTSYPTGEGSGSVDQCQYILCSIFVFRFTPGLVQ